MRNDFCNGQISAFCLFNRTKQEFISFMGIDSLPEMQRNPRGLTIEGANAKDYGAWATVYYDVTADKYMLDVWKEIY